MLLVPFFKGGVGVLVKIVHNVNDRHGDAAELEEEGYQEQN
jgi:hypothetical protein